MEASADQNPAVRAAVLEALSWHTWPAKPAERAVLVGAIIPALNDKDARVRRAAAEALRAAEQTPPEAVPALLRLVAKDAAARTRMAAAASLGSARRTPAIDRALVKALRDRDRWVRANAADALVTLGATRQGITGLARSMDDPETAPAVRPRLDALGAAARRQMLPAIGRLRKRLATLIRRAQKPTKNASELDGVLGTAWEDDVKALLIALGADAAPLLPALMEVSARRFGVLGVVDDVLVGTGQAGAKELLRVLRQGSPSARKHAADVLGNFEHQLHDIAVGLLAATRDKNSAVRAQAVRSLINVALGHPRQGHASDEAP